MKQDRPARSNAIRLAIVYFVVTVLWILGSDHLANLVAQNAAQLHIIQSVKGIVFVTAMAVLVGIGAARLAAAEAARQRALMFASTDPVTQLPNARTFYAAIAAALAEDDRQCCVLVLDVRGFSRINNTFGRQTGDQALFTAGHRLRALVNANAKVARLEEDKFAVLLDDATSESAMKFANRIIDRFRQEMRVAGQSLLMDINVGFALSGDDGDHVASLLDAAELALRAAKESGRNTACRFSRELMLSRREHFHLETELRQALIDGTLALHLQPEFELASGRLVGAEALLRWMHPSRGAISPAVFIPVAEHAGLIEHVGEYVLRATCRTLSEWRRAGLPSLRVAVNIAGQQLDDERLAFYLRQAAEEWNVPLSLLEIEITETMAMRNPERALEVLAHLRSLGVTIALDDFGTGYSSLSYLLQLPVDKLKIDRSFIAGLEDDVRQSIFVRTIVALGHDLGISVAAEGIESETQHRHLLELGCDLGQGYFLARPMSTDDFERLLRKHHDNDISG